MTNGIKMRARMVRMMDTYVRDVIGDEVITMFWLENAVPDGADDIEILEDVADDDIFEEWVAAFKTCLYLERNSDELEV